MSSCGKVEFSNSADAPFRVSAEFETESTRVTVWQFVLFLDVHVRNTNLVFISVHTSFKIFNMPPPPFIAPTEEPHTYTGICRCKANKFTVELPKLVDTLQCDCSICSVHDIMWLFRTTPKFEREGPTIDYEWLEKKYKFCVRKCC